MGTCTHAALHAAAVRGNELRQRVDEERAAEKHDDAAAHYCRRDSSIFFAAQITNGFSGDSFIF